MPVAEWEAEWYWRERRGVRDSDQPPPPGLVFLYRQCPSAVRKELLSTVEAVRRHPPPTFPSRSGRWVGMRGEMAGIFEARDKLDRTLYRLFCILDRDAGRPKPLVVILGGGVKPVQTAMDDDVYLEILRRRKTYLASTPRPLALPGLVPMWIQQWSGELGI